MRAAFGSKRLSELTALLRILVGVVSAAAVALAFAGYLSSFLPGMPTVVVAIELVVAMAGVNFWGIETSARLNVLFTAVEVLGLLLIVAVGVVDWQALGASTSPLALVAERGWGTAAGSILAIIALFSTTNTVPILQISTSRMLYGVSKAEHRSFPTVFSQVHPNRRTPHYAVLLVGVVTVGFSLLDDVGVVAGLANLFLLVVFVLINGALLALRYREPDREWGFTAPGNVGRLSMTAVG